MQHAKQMEQRCYKRYNSVCAFFTMLAAKRLPLPCCRFMAPLLLQLFQKPILFATSNFQMHREINL
jgi:hypothetical protein